MRKTKTKSSEYQLEYARAKYKDLKAMGMKSYLVRDTPEFILKVKSFVKELRRVRDGK